VHSVNNIQKHLYVVSSSHFMALFFPVALPKQILIYMSCSYECREYLYDNIYGDVDWCIDAKICKVK